MLIIILSITTISIFFPFSKKVSSIPKTFDFGMYLIIVFCLIVASQAHITKFKEESTTLMQYIGYVIIGTLLVKLVLSKFFKIDTNTTMITSTSLICSPPFVPLIAGSLKNKEIILPGLTVKYSVMLLEIILLYFLLI